MANVFVVEWTENNQRIRQKVEFGNFNGDIPAAQRALDGFWPSAFPDRTDTKVISIVGAGEVVRVQLPAGAPDNALEGRTTTIAEPAKPAPK